MSTDFLIHRDSEGRIVRAIPYANIAEMQYTETKASYGTSEHQEIINVYYHVYYILQNGNHLDFSVDSRETAERYLAEWREWWEKKSRRVLGDVPAEVVFEKMYEIMKFLQYKGEPNAH